MWDWIALVEVFFCQFLGRIQPFEARGRVPLSSAPEGLTEVRWVIIPEMGLQEVQEDGDVVDRKRPDVHRVEPVGVFLHAGLRAVDQSEVRQLVNGVKPTGAPSGDRGFLG